MSNLTSFQKTGKTLVFIILLLVILGVTIVLGKGASTIFTAKASSCNLLNVSALQTTSNSSVINWTTQETSQGRVEYGTDPSNFTFSQLEGAEGTSHNVPLTLLTPSTTYYYVINVKNTRCDSKGQVCTDKCQPWQFTTTPVGSVEKVSSQSPTSSPSGAAGAKMSTFCTELSKQIGQTKTSSGWATVKQYDLDSNGIVNSMDAVRCQKEGK